MSREGGRIILGIDPGAQVTGYGLICQKGRETSVIDCGCIRPPRGSHISETFRLIFEELSELLNRFEPTEMAVETQFIQHNVQSGIKLGMARGVAMLAGSLRRIPLFGYPPARVKKAVVGNGRASKEQVVWMVSGILSVSDKLPEDAADALAVALCHSHFVDCYSAEENPFRI